jgi:hypothetical protein
MSTQKKRERERERERRTSMSQLFDGESEEKDMRVLDSSTDIRRRLVHCRCETRNDVAMVAGMSKDTFSSFTCCSHDERQRLEDVSVLLH